MSYLLLEIKSSHIYVLHLHRFNVLGFKILLIQKLLRKLCPPFPPSRLHFLVVVSPQY